MKHYLFSLPEDIHQTAPLEHIITIKSDWNTSESRPETHIIIIKHKTLSDIT